jgi:hypothetical protein
MRRIGLFTVVAGLLPLLAATPASAQATRTWVSGVGDDVNPCSRTAPCKTFAGAISKTDAGGQINCLDPGGFGGVTITKSITLDCGATSGSILTGNGITIKAGLNDRVTLRGIQLHGLGRATNFDMAGIRILAAAVVSIEDTVVSDYGRQSIYDARTADTTKLFIRNSVISSNTGTGSVHILAYGVIQERDRSGETPCSGISLVNSDNYGGCAVQPIAWSSSDLSATYQLKHSLLPYNVPDVGSRASGPSAAIFPNVKTVALRNTDDSIAEYTDSFDVRSARELFWGQAQNRLLKGDLVHLSEEAVQRHDVVAWLSDGEHPTKRPASSLTPTPLEGSGLLGMPFGPGNDYTRRLELFRKFGGYIPSTPSKPSK